MDNYWQKVKNIFKIPVKDYKQEEQTKTYLAIEKFILNNSNKDSLLLDAGCSIGNEGFRLYKSGFKGMYFGVDNNTKTIKIAKKNSKTNNKMNFYLLNLEKLNFKTNYFDIVLVKDVIENQQYYVKILTELIRVAKKYLILSMSIKPSVFLGDKIKLHQKSGYQNRYNQAKLFAFIIKHHFKKPQKIYEDWQDITYVFEKVV